MKISNNVAVGIIGVNKIREEHNLKGKGQIIAIADTGLDNSVTCNSLATCNANITDADEDSIVWANFTIRYPNGSAAINNTNGTQNGDIWISSSITANIQGTWNCTVMASDRVNIVEDSIIFPVIKPKGIISTTAGDTPFYTISNNPQSCLDMKKDNTCNLTWTVNATGTINGVWEFYAIYNATEYPSYLNDNVSNKVNITILPS